MLAVAHRGFSSAYPENTALAFDKAIDAGADLIETDVRLSRDGRIVCWHDPDLKRVAGKAQAIADLEWRELKGITLPSGQTILGLDEVLAIARGRAGVMLDVKITTDEMVATIVPLLESTGMTDNVVYGARAVEHLRAVHRRCPQLAVLGMPPDPGQLGDYLKHGVRGARFWEDDVTPERVHQVRQAGCEVWVTAGLRKRGEVPGYATLERVVALAKLGVGAVLVNDPRLVLMARAVPSSSGMSGSPA